MLKVTHKISYNNKQFVIQTGLHQSTQKWLSQSKLLFALVFKRQTLEAGSLHSAALPVIFSIPVNKSDCSHTWSCETVLLKHLDLYFGMKILLIEPMSLCVLPNGILHIILSLKSVFVCWFWSEVVQILLNAECTLAAKPRPMSHRACKPMGLRSSGIKLNITGYGASPQPGADTHALGV